MLKKTTCSALIVLLVMSLFSFPSYALTVSSAPPVSASDTEEKWILDLGTDYKNAPSIPVLSGNYLYVMSGKKILKVSKETGKIVCEGNMSGRPTYAYVPVTVAAGKVFCPIGDGVIEAFDADNLNKLWSAHDPLEGQALTDIYYYDGKIFTGFWNSDVHDANFVSIDASTGEILWSITRAGGYYWAECARQGNYLIISGDDGSSDFDGDNFVSTVDISTGSVIDTVNIIGDVRSGITVDSGSVYIVTKGAYLYKTKVNGNGSFGDVTTCKLAGYSTSTPTVYDGSVYIGMYDESTGNGFIGAFDAQTLTAGCVIRTPGFPQRELLISSAFDDPVIYSTYNKGPGGLIAVTYSGDKMSLENLYVPPEGKRSYCISSICADENGDLYYKNDSGSVFALTHKSAENEEPKEKTLFDYIRDFFKSIGDFFKKIFSVFSR